MSDHDVIVQFVGRFVSDGTIEAISSNKHASWYPGARVELELFEVPILGTNEAYAKEVIDDHASAFPAKHAIEAAVYRVDGNSLVARDIEVAPGLLVTETLTLRNGDMVHSLQFSDGENGRWICKRPGTI
jgi:hypothetical protein